MVDYVNRKMFYQTSVDKQLLLEFDSGIKITNENILSESMEIVESICSSNELKFGSAEASSFKIKVANQFGVLKGDWVNVSMTLEGDTANPLRLGRFKIESDRPTADRLYRELVGYDAMKDIINTDVGEWYRKLPITDTQSMTLSAFRKSLVAYLGLEEQDPSLVLINDDISVFYTIDSTEISAKDILKYIGELTASFPHVDRYGKFEYVSLVQMTKTLYPRDNLHPQNELYPDQPQGSVYLSSIKYLNSTYEDYETVELSEVVIKQYENDNGTRIGEEGNAYFIELNPLIQGANTDELKRIGRNILDKVIKITYRPADVEAVGNPCITVGDGIRLDTRFLTLYTYVLTRRLTGIQALRDNYEAQGSEYQSLNINSQSRTTSGLSSELGNKVSKGQVSSEISQESGQVIIRGNRLVIDSTNFKLTENGDATFGGTVQGAKVLSGNRTKLIEDVVGLYVGNDGFDLCWDATNEFSDTKVYGHFRCTGNTLKFIVGGREILSANSEGRVYGANVGPHIHISNLIYDAIHQA